MVRSALRTGSSVPLLLVLAWLLPVAMLAWLAVVIAPEHSGSRAGLLAVAVLAPAAGLWLAARAGLGGGLALALIAAAMVLLSDASVREHSGGGADAQSVLKFGVWMLGLLLLWWRGAELRRTLAHPPSGLIAVFGLCCLLSSTYSATPLYTLAAALGLLGIWVAAGSLALALPERAGLLTIVTALLLAMALSLLLYVLVPAQAMTPTENGRILRLSGLFGSPNNLGRAAALTILLAVVLWPRIGRWRGAALVALALALGGSCLSLSDNRGSLLGLTVALAVFALGRQRMLAVGLSVIVVSVVLWMAAALDLPDSLLGLVSRSGRISEVTTLTGRTEIWRAVWVMIQNAPLLGYGYASSREVIPLGFQGAFGWTTTSAHNLWLQAWLTTGALGLVLVLAAQAAWLREAWLRHHPARDAVISFVMVVGIFEASALGPSVNLMTFVWCWAAALGLRPRDE